MGRAGAGADVDDLSREQVRGEGAHACAMGAGRDPDGPAIFGLWLRPGDRRHLGLVQGFHRWAKRDRFGDASDFIGWYMDRTEKANGIAKHDARNQYLAYHEGHTGYTRGSWRNKSWLVRVADSVADRAAMYDRQLRSCRRR